MDFDTTWNISESPEGLLEVIMTCKKELTKNCFSKFGSAKIQDYRVSASQKVCELLLLSEGHTPIKSKEFDSACHKAVASFDSFKLFKTKMFGDSIMRIEACFDIGEGMGKYWYASITLI